MSDEKQDIANAYGAVMARSSKQRIDIKTKINLDAPSVRAAFGKASNGQDAVDDNMISDAVGVQTHVYRSNPLNDVHVMQNNEFRALTNIIDRKLATGVWGEKEIKEYNDQIARLSGLTRMDQDHIWTMSKDYENTMVQLRQDWANGYLSPPASALKQKIGETLVKEATGGKLTQAEKDELSRNLDTLSRQDGVRRETLDNYTQTFEQNVRKDVIETRKNLISGYDGEADDRRRGAGKSYGPYNGYSPEYHMTVAKVLGTGNDALLEAWAISKDDPPGKLPPGSHELGELLIALHESEHTARQYESIAPVGMSPTARVQAEEIDADNAILKFLDQSNDPASKEYWLQNREVTSFTAGLGCKNGLDHDTATFLRVYEKTGKQIDLDTFETQKRGLFDRIRQKMMVQQGDPGEPTKVGDTMGAVKDVLDEDNRQTDKNKKLIPTQRAEAESFMRDAEAMGYKINPDYPKAPPSGPQTERKFDPIPPPPPPPEPPKN